MFEKTTELYQSAGSAAENLSNQIMDHVKNNWNIATRSDAPTTDRLLAGTMLVGEGLAAGAALFTVGRFASNRILGRGVYPAEKITFDEMVALRQTPANKAAYAVCKGAHIKAFQKDLTLVLGPKIRASEQATSEVWGSMANVLWTHAKYPPVSHSWRASGDLLAKIRGNGDYMDWYYSSQYATVPRWVQRSMAAKGWQPKVLID